LARRSDFYIVGLEKDADKVERARQRLASVGLLGVRVVVLQGASEEAAFPKHFANLIVSGRSVDQVEDAEVTKEAARCQRPWGGIICLGKLGRMQVEVNGPLPGAGSWTHLYANAANTGSSNDQLVKGPLRMFWFGGPSLDVPDRHSRPPGPLFYEGRLYAFGLDAIRAVDAYNGHLIWECPLDGIGDSYAREGMLGVAGTGGDYCVGPEGLFVRSENKCLRIDAATGQKIGAFEVPKQPDDQPAQWGHLSLDGGLLFGTTTNHANFIRRGMMKFKTESNSLFAMDAKIGEVKWTYQAQHSIRNNAIAVGEGRVFLIDRPVAAFEQGISPARRGEHAAGELVALRAADGKQLWRTDEIQGTTLLLSIEHDVLLVTTQAGAYALPSEAGSKLAAFKASSGQRLWEVAERYRSRPMIIGETVYAEPYSYDLTSGKKAAFNFQRLHGCGTVLGCPNLLLFRSGPLGYVDLTSGKTGKSAVEYYGGTRPGCWANAIPAGGSVFLPNSFNSCSCSYLNRTNIALRGSN
jgi:outer membrane protein assembly factor BamB